GRVRVGSTGRCCRGLRMMGRGPKEQARPTPSVLWPQRPAGISAFGAASRGDLAGSGSGGSGRCRLEAQYDDAGVVAEFEGAGAESERCGFVERGRVACCDVVRLRVLAGHHRLTPGTVSENSTVPGVGAQDAPIPIDSLKAGNCSIGLDSQ